MASLSEDLELNIQPALSSVADLASELGKAAQDFSSAFAEAFAVAVNSAITSINVAPLEADLTSSANAGLAAVDTAPLETAITEAAQAADTSVTITAPDATEVTSSIADAAQSADTSITVSGTDTAIVGEDITAAVASADTAVTVGPVDASEVSAAITDAVEGADTSTSIGGPTAGGVSGGGRTAAAGIEAAGAAEGFTALERATRSVETANAGLEGSVGGVTSALGPYGAAVAGVTGAMGIFFTEAVQQETAQRRLEFVFGETASKIEQVTLPLNNFDRSLKDIALSTGASDNGLLQANSRIGALGFSAGAAAPLIAQTANQITALATYLAVTNPALGTADEIMNSLTGALARGGRATLGFGISLTSTEIAAKAQSIAIADGRDQVTQYDKVAAGAAITTERLGGSLGDAVTKGADSAALALPKLKEQLKQTLETAGTPLIGPITQAFADLGPVLSGLATTIGHLLQAFTPVLGVLGAVAAALSVLTDIINAIPIPILTTAVEAFTAALVLNKVSAFAAGLFTLGANATADVGAIGLLTGAVDGLVASLGPVGVAVAAIGAIAIVSNVAMASNTDNASKMALATAGLKSNTDVAKESAAQLQQQLDGVNAKIKELQAQSKSAAAEGLVPLFDTSGGKVQALDYASSLKALTGEAGTLKTALNAAKSSTDGQSASQSSAAQTAEQFGAAIQAAGAKLGGVASAMAAVESANATLVSGAVSKLPGVAGVFGDVSSAIDAAAKASASQAASSGSASSALAAQATHAKDLRDATAALTQAEAARDVLAAGPTNEQRVAGLLSIDSAAKTVRDDLQKVNDTETALATLEAGQTAEQRAAGLLSIAQAAQQTHSAEQTVLADERALRALEAGPTADTKAQAAENVAKAQLNRQKTVLALNDAITAQAALEATGTATDRQKTDAQIKRTEAEFAQTDASRALNDAIAVQAKLTNDSLSGSAALSAARDKLAGSELALQAAQQSQKAVQDKQAQAIADSLPGSAAMTTARNNEADAELSLAQAQVNQQTVQAKQNQLFADALPGSEAYAAVLQKVADAHDHLTSVVEAGVAKQGAASAAQAKTHVDALHDILKGLDDQIAAEDKFFSDLRKIQAEGGTEIVAELLALGPKQGAAEASAVATATVSTVTAMEQKTEKLKSDEDRHAKEIATIFGASLNANLLKAFSTQLENETSFYANVTAILLAGGKELVKILLAQPMDQASATAAAIAGTTPVLLKEMEAQAEQLKAKEKALGTDIGATFGDGLFAGINGANARVFAAAASLGDSAKAGTTSVIKPGSPSRVAMELGNQWAEGLALGISGGVPLVASAASQLASALVVNPNAPALVTGSTVASTAGASSGSFVQHVVVNVSEVAQDPQATAFAVASRLGQQAMR